MNYSPISLSRLDPPQLRKALQGISQALEEMGIDFYLIGAVARDLFLGQVYNLKVSRPTLDLDVAVLVANQNEYVRLKQHLVQLHGFRELSTNAFALLHPNGITVDLMPFGEITEADDWVKVEGRGMTSITVPGIAEAYEEAEELQTKEGQRWRVCTLPGMCVLKLLAWQDRPEARNKDLVDLAHIIGHYEYVAQDALFDLHYDLLVDNTIDSASPRFMLQISARLLGRHMQMITKRSQRLHQRITYFLQTETEAAGESKLVQAWARVNNCLLEDAHDLIQRLLLGLQDPFPSNG